MWLRVNVIICTNLQPYRIDGIQNDIISSRSLTTSEAVTYVWWSLMGMAIFLCGEKYANVNKEENYG